MLRVLVASFHLLALGFGLGAVLTRRNSQVQALLVALMIFAAVAMARGYGLSS